MIFGIEKIAKKRMKSSEKRFLRFIKTAHIDLDVSKENIFM